MPTDASVCAVIYGRAHAPSPDAVREAVQEQTLPPSEILELAVPADGSGMVPAVARAAGRRERWLWLLDGRALPAADALERLLDALELISDSIPVLLCSRVLDSQGALHPDAAPRHEIFEKERSVHAIEHGLVQLRIAGPGSVLVGADAAERFGPPRSDLPDGLDLREWTARMLRSWDDTGYLVPASVAVRAQPPRAVTARDWAGRVRMIASRAWTPTERLWETFLLTETAAESMRTRLGGASRAAGGPLRDAAASAPAASDRHGSHEQ